MDPAATQGALPWRSVAEWLTRARNDGVCPTRPDGRPHAAPVWGLWLDDAVYFSTDPASRKGRNLAANPELVVHLESGDEVAILEGSAEQVADRSLLARFAEAYEAKYALRLEVDDLASGVYRLRPRVVLAWNKRDFPTSAPRWRFARG